MDEQLERLVSSLLYEGYALYPYTPGATKNATPTPFGIVYPSDYAGRSDSTFDHLRAQCVLATGPGTDLSGTVRFLQAAGERHRATERRLEIHDAPLERLLDGGVGERFRFEGEPAVYGRIKLRADETEHEGLYRISMCVHNETELGSDHAEAERADALRASLLSTHLVIETSRGRFASPLEREGPEGAAVAACESVNTFPVLAPPTDDAVLAAAIVLPDHPRMAPESLGNLFDNTEIEEALLLHVHALSDSEREAIAAQDPAVREMVQRASATTPQQIMALHGRLEEVEPEPGHPNPGEDEVTVGGVALRKGAKVTLRPATDRDVYDRMLAGRTATIERIYVDYDDDVHVGVTVDDDPAQGLFRETGRYLFFKGNELEAMGP